MILIEFDKAGAEWVIVAYLSGDARMLDIIDSGKSPHVVTGHLITDVPEELIVRESKIVGMNTDPDLIFQLRSEHLPELLDLEEKGVIFLPRSMSIRQCGKKSNHGLNYGERYRTFALTNEIEEREAKIIVDSYTTVAYTSIPLWWESIKRQLRKDRTLVSILGRKIEFMDEWGDELFRAAYSFDPQSTIGDMVNDALITFEADRETFMYKADALTQTHDSATMQYPENDWLDMARYAIRFGLDYMSPELEANGRKFHVGTEMKIGFEWGAMTEVPLSRNVKEVAHALESVWSKLHEH